MAGQLLRTHISVISLLYKGWLQPDTLHLTLKKLHLIAEIGILSKLLLQSVYSFASTCKPQSDAMV